MDVSAVMSRLGCKYWKTNKLTPMHPNVCIKIKFAVERNVRPRRLENRSLHIRRFLLKIRQLNLADTVLLIRSFHTCILERLNKESHNW